MMDVGIQKSIVKQDSNTKQYGIYVDTKLPQSETKRKSDLSYDLDSVLSKLGIEITEE